MDMWHLSAHTFHRTKVKHLTNLIENKNYSDILSCFCYPGKRQISNDSKEYLRYIHTPNPAPRRRETRFEKSSPAKVPEPQPLEDSWRFFGLGSERAQFFGGVVAGGPSGGQEEEEGVDQSHRKADISSLAGVGALQ